MREEEDRRFLVNQDEDDLEADVEVVTASRLPSSSPPDDCLNIVYLSSLVAAIGWC